MKFTTREDVEAPIEAVFAMVSDFEGFERAALRRGAEVRRTDSCRQKGVGYQWDTAFDMRGRRREVSISLTQYDPVNGMAFEFTAQGLGGDFGLELVPLSRSRTRLSMSMELKPKTLSARLLVQSLKLARNNLSKRMNIRMAKFAQELEDRYKRGEA